MNIWWDLKLNKFIYKVIYENLCLYSENAGQKTKRIVNEYNKSYRKYHNLEHIMKCLDIADDLIEYSQFESLMIEDYEEHIHRLINISIIYHDYIYEPLSNLNEHFSCEAAKHDLIKQCVDKGDMNIVYQMILATDHDNTRKLSIYDKYICDIDLHQLGCGLNEFLLNESKIREEYNMVVDNIFYPARIRILQKFLDREFIYYMPEFRGRFETNARCNIEYVIGEYLQMGEWRCSVSEDQNLI